MLIIQSKNESPEHVRSLERTLVKIQSVKIKFRVMNMIDINKSALVDVRNFHCSSNLVVVLNFIFRSSRL